jgi:membrane dipeptidase
VAPDKLAAGGVGAVVMSIAVGPGPRTPQGDAAGRAEADEKLAAIRALDAEHDQIVIATTPDEVLAVRAQGRTALILGFQNARSLEGDPAALDAFYAAGVRVFGLNHMGHNDFSDSSRPLYDGETKSYEAGAEHGGLSTLGVQAIARINALGGIVDVSQMSKDATLQAIALSTTPVIASHSNVRALSDVSRNLSDEEIDRIGETGGVIHVAAFGAYLVDLSDADLLAQIRAVRREAGLPEPYSYPYELYWELHDPAAQTAFLTAMRDVIGRGSVDRMIDHVDYIVARIGIDHVGIGTDFNHGGGVEGFNEADEAFNVTLSLIERGYAPDDIEKIWGGNFLRVFQAVLPASARRRSASCWRLSSWSPRSMR